MTLPVTEQSPEQRLESLKLANQVRLKRGLLKKSLKEKETELPPLIEDPPEWALTMKVYDLLVALPRVGHKRATHILKMSGATPFTKLGTLSPRQRTELVTRLRSYTI